MSHKVYVLGFDNKVTHKITGVNYIDLGSGTNKLNLIIQSIILSLKVVFKSNGIANVFNTFKGIVTFKTGQLKQQNFNYSLKNINPDIVHIQWISLLPYCKDILVATKYTTILSQLGYQLNVRANIDKENRELLKQWSPKITGFHSVSKAIKDQSALIYKSEDKIDQVIYSGFDFSKIKKIVDYKKTDTLKLLSVGRPHWIKGYDYMIKACLKLKENNISFQYTIIGADINEELLYIIKMYGLENEITLTPSIPHENVFRIMSESSLLVLPSIAEGIANVVIEAMAIGLPVLSTKCGGVIELITEKESGFLAEIRNETELFLKIKAFNEMSVDEINTIRIAARKKVEDQNNIDKMVNDFEKLYLGCINANRSSHKA